MPSPLSLPHRFIFCMVQFSHNIFRLLTVPVFVHGVSIIFLFAVCPAGKQIFLQHFKAWRRDKQYRLGAPFPIHKNVLFGEWFDMAAQLTRNSDFVYQLSNDCRIVVQQPFEQLIIPIYGIVIPINSQQCCLDALHKIFAILDDMLYCFCCLRQIVEQDTQLFNCQLF